MTSGPVDRRRDTVDEILAAWQAELPEITTTSFELAKRVARLAARLTEAANGELVHLGLTKAEYEVLSLLRASGPPYRLRPTDLAVRLSLSSGGTSNLLRRLAEAGLVVRESAEQDARSSWVQLTEQGVRLSAEAARTATDAQRALLAGVPEETQRATADLLREVLVNLGDHPRR